MGAVGTATPVSLVASGRGDGAGSLAVAVPPRLFAPRSLLLWESARFGTQRMRGESAESARPPVDGRCLPAACSSSLPSRQQAPTVPPPWTAMRRDVQTVRASITPARAPTAGSARRGCYCRLFHRRRRQHRHRTTSTGHDRPSVPSSRASASAACSSLLQRRFFVRR
jgi:hypothetical protein